MNNKVYYGEYSLMHWIKLILKKNIILPDYQRYFVWDEPRTALLIKTFKEKRFVPPVTIGAFKSNEGNQNLILDGQQRLTSLLLAFLGLFPDEATFKKTKERFMDENDIDDEDDYFDNILEWKFDELLKKGNTKDQILDGIVEGNYKIIDFDVSEGFLKNNFLGFSYLVPQTNDAKSQQRFYSSVFRNINIQGESLLPQESRAALYYFDNDLVNFFDPDFIKSIKVKGSGSDIRIDFLRYLALLSQYYKDASVDKVAIRFGRKMEKYYEEYIYSVVQEDNSEMFGNFTDIFVDKQYDGVLDVLKSTIESLGLEKKYISIIDLDIYFFGLVYVIMFEKKEVDLGMKDELINKIDLKISELKRPNDYHARNPNALKYLRMRILESISIYRGYTR